MSRIYALLVGINDYPEGVRKLTGCVDDVGRYREYLTRRFPAATLAIESLTDAQASRAGVIDGFKQHLGKAGEGDVALFQYCGHGARSTAAPEFLQFAPDGMEEGLVCHDSRQPGQFDLADKELAVLIAGVAKNNPHIAVILDSCHSGSGTRSAEEIAGAVARFEEPASYKREIQQYLDEYYLKQGNAIVVPSAQHILLAACAQRQTAKERNRAGIFTGTFLEVLEKSGGSLSYADLFVRCRAAVRKRAADQDPQFETIGGFSAASGFLGGAVDNARPYRAVYDQGAWRINCGAINGAPTDPARSVGFALYPDAGGDAVGTATTTTVGPGNSVLALGFASAPGVLAYAAAMTSLPVAPMIVAFDGPEPARAALAAELAKDGAIGVALGDAGALTEYAIVPADNLLFLVHVPSGRRVQGVEVDAADPGGNVRHLVPALRSVAAWHRGLGLRNDATKLDRSRVDVVFVENRPDGSVLDHPPGEVRLDFSGAARTGLIKVRNRTDQPLHVALVYFSDEYEVKPLRNEELPVGDPAAAAGGWLTLMGEAGEHFSLKNGVDQALDSFKLIVSTERIDDFLLAQAPLEMGEVWMATRSGFNAGPKDRDVAKLAHRDEWFTVDYRMNQMRQLDRVGPVAATLAGGAITVLAHPSVTAGLALTAATDSTRSSDTPDFPRALAQQGISLVDFSDGTRGASANVLEISGIENAAALAQTPLKIVLKPGLKADETIVPLVLDGAFVRLGGDSAKADDGSVTISIDALPQGGEGARSVLGALKLYFFKTVLRQENVNLLRWVDYSADGKPVRQVSGIEDKVAAAKRILLIVHGIIGDTDDIAAGVAAAGIVGKFDLVLTYDYENLNTPIGETAANLEKALLGVGIGAGDGKSVTLLAHSMGGLVARWMIEHGDKEDDEENFIDHLVMCGTPNGGSPFGEAASALAIVRLLGDMAANVLPGALPFVAPLKAVLKIANGVTPTLEQMSPKSKFILDLNAGGDPGVRYTILAGDVDAYAATQDAFFGRLMTAAGRSAAFDLLFDNRPNDIAVGKDSIRRIGGVRAAPPQRIDVACHHLNYFASPAGQAALAEIDWG